ncbi:flagellar hook-associated protein FlgK [Mesorhizobium sp. KR9-304]|uniref:flagellar hook-associated protein FlgK n=1 Tax=Mesorhizobium sp. KR9-304 TaxID=3156614 RepID=UPI0032B31FC7
MSLSSALSIAQSSIRNTARQTSIVSRNVLEANNPDYSRRMAVTTNTTGARSIEIQRAANEQLFRQNLQALSAWNGQSTLYNGMEQLNLSINGIENGNSPATVIGKLQEALQLYSASPSNRNLAETTLDAARQVVRTLNDGTNAIQSFRAVADQEISTAVGELNNLLADLEKENNAVVSGTRSGRDISDALDQRDATLKKIAEYVPISTLTRGDNDMIVLTKDGSTLFETVPRSVSFTPTGVYSPGTTGGKVFIDGVPIDLAAGGNTGASGRIAGMIQLRDGVTVTMQGQLDEIARGLIAAFAETSPTNALPEAPGLFTWLGAPAMPAAGTLVTGLAGQIRLNPAMDSARGGNPELLRDGGASGAGYVHNTGGNASYSGLLISYGDRIDAPMAFDPSTGIESSSSLADYSTAAIGWFDGMRKEASDAAASKEALAVYTAEALSNETGVNIDMEMSLLLDLEHSYEASARLIRAVDEMLAALLEAVR